MQNNSEEKSILLLKAI